MGQQFEFDFTAAAPVPGAPPVEARPRRAERGAVGYLAGLAAEDCVAQDYARRGYAVADRRWRGRGGEIDLVLHDGAGFVFVEVKKSRDFDRALARLSQRQVRRLQSAAEEYVGGTPGGALTDMRFDVALVDAHGFLRVIENAFGP
ncbi:YraN family protein [Salipiger mucosus]|uniref:UPF0102 protein Salmuc_04104 n=1 Tax=Salipiger mucosus DSM 16094 TaxID=1123237 RepID=S9RRX3_9RHOB|nr:YraN family protein [Salipiger mucosus]EPX76709.1 identified by similarity to GB.1, match to protein family HMM [Salipiger mucosus DSM 16094]